MAALGRQRKRIKGAILIKRSTKTIIKEGSLDFGRSTIKSVDNSDHGIFGVERGEGRPWGLWRGTLFLQQISQDLTNLETSLDNFGHHKLREISSDIFLIIKWPVETESWWSSRIHVLNDKGT